MTVTAMPPAERVVGTNSDAGRLRLTAGQLIARAHMLIVEYGHSDDVLGSPATGFGLTGAVYAGAGFYIDRYNLEDPWLCGSHRRRRGEFPAPCDPRCEWPLWDQCNLAFTYLATALRTPVSEEPYLVGLKANSRDYQQVCEADEILDTHSAVRVLGRVLRGLELTVPGRRPRSSLALAAGR